MSNFKNLLRPVVLIKLLINSVALVYILLLLFGNKDASNKEMLIMFSILTIVALVDLPEDLKKGKTFEQKTVFYIKLVCGIGLLIITLFGWLKLIVN